MYVILTGDLVNSRSLNGKVWLPVLEDALCRYTKKFDIFRGDSFQAELDIAQCLEAVFYIKAKLKTIPNLDVRMAVGLGQVEHEADHIKSSTGEAFVFSGEAFDALGKELFAVKSNSTAWDTLTNTVLSIAIELANKWTVNMAETVVAVIEQPDYNQQDLAKILNRKYQSQVSTEISKAHWVKIKRAIDYCQQELLKLC